MTEPPRSTTTEEAGNGRADPRAAEKSATAFRTISEVADELGIAQHVLRFWETKFSQIRPLKRAGGRRFYRPEDIEILREIRILLYDQGFTIRGAQKHLRAKRSTAPATSKTQDRSEPPRLIVDGPGTGLPPVQGRTRERLLALRAELVELRSQLSTALHDPAPDAP